LGIKGISQLSFHHIVAHPCLAIGPKRFKQQIEVLTGQKVSFGKKKNHAKASS
jgi:hypothetical protein